MEKWTSDDTTVKSLVGNLNEQYPLVSCIFSSVRKSSAEFDSFLQTFLFRLIRFNSSTPLPIQINYDTQETLGTDRIANCVAANSQFPGSNSLVVDFGTCITYTLLIEKSLVGGAISPGLKMRFKALNTFTGRLPLIEASETPPIIGTSTESSIRSGVQQGVLLEVEAMIHTICSQKSVSNVLITGGDLSFFEHHLKSRTFADPNLTVKGLNEILEYNAE